MEKRKEYILVNWPVSEVLKSEPWFNTDCYLTKKAGLEFYFVSKDKISKKYKDLFNTSIDELGLSLKNVSQLKSKGLMTLGQLSKELLWRERGIGVRTVDGITQVVKQL